ncbi:MAG: hypothetical protein ACREQ5_04390 [Candidatus Dormibacteria bacterium]
MRKLHEILQVALETLGILLLAVGLGVAASWLCGWAGFLVVSGVLMLSASWRAELALHPRKPKPKPEQKPVEPGGPRLIERTFWRFGWLRGRPSPATQLRRQSIIVRSVGRVAWLRDPEESSR